MASVSYIFGDVLTGAVIDDISLYGASFASSLDGGELRGTFQYDQTGKNNSTLNAATQPGRCYVVAEREGIPVWGGLVWTRTYQSQAKIEQLYCRTFDFYADRRIMDFDYLATDIEQTQLFLNIFQEMMNDPYSIQYVLPTSINTGILKSIEVKGAEYKSFRQVLDSIADADNGFDWIIDVNKNGGIYQRNLRIGYPTIGSGSSAALTVFDYPGNITNYWRNESMAESATNLYTIGAGEGESMITSRFTHTDTLAGGFPRYDNDLSLKDINDQTMLDALTRQKAEILKPPMPIYTVEIKGDRVPSFGSFGVGDACQLHILDPKHSDGMVLNTRILSWEYTPQSDSSEEKVRLTFEGDELS